LHGASQNQHCETHSETKGSPPKHGYQKKIRDGIASFSHHERPIILEKQGQLKGEGAAQQPGKVASSKSTPPAQAMQTEG